MGNLLSVVSLGDDYYLEYSNENTGYQVKVKVLSPVEVRQYEELMEELQSAEVNLLETFL